MAEYIEREAAKDKFSDLLPIGRSIRQSIDEIPTADVVEVVRCKDCKYYRPQVKSAQWENKTNYCCRTAVIKVKPNDFCSYGEAKMDGKGEG